VFSLSIHRWCVSVCLPLALEFPAGFNLQYGSNSGHHSQHHRCPSSTHQGGAHRGHISRIKTYYKSMADMPLRQQQAEEIKHFLTALDENTRILGVIKDQLKSLDPGLLEALADELSTHHTLSISLQVELEALLQASHPWILGP